MFGCTIRDLLPTHITVPLHDSLKTGTLHTIVTEVAQMSGITAEALMELL
jgi:hypothetical protein